MRLQETMHSLLATNTNVVNRLHSSLFGTSENMFPLIASQNKNSSTKLEKNIL